MEEGEYLYPPPSNSESTLSHNILPGIVAEQKYIHLRRAKKLISSCKDFVVCDVETTGFSPRYGDRIIEIAYQKYRIHDDELKKIGKTHCFFVNPGRSIPQVVQELTGITDAKVKDGVSQSKAKESFKKFLGDNIIVGHNFQFDLRFLNYRFRDKIKGDKVVDTLHLSKIYEERKDLDFSNSLDAVATELGVVGRVDGVHSASVDIDITAKIFHRVMKKLV